jgi:hypothetical protein
VYAIRIDLFLPNAQAEAGSRLAWRLSTNSLVQGSLTNEWLDKQGVPNLQASWIAYHYPPKKEPSAPVLVTSQAK